MQPPDLGPDAQLAVREVLGYLNFSAGTADPRFQRNIALLAAQDEAASHDRPWRALVERLRAELGLLADSSPAFRDISQAEAVLSLTFDRFLPAFIEWHRDLLHHQTEAALLQPFFLARACEAILRQGPPWDEADRVVHGALAQLNDFIGHRPVAVLRTPQKIEPYEHEWVFPLPLYLRGAGVAPGKYHDLIEQVLAILAATDKDILNQAHFDLDLLDELALDPRAYDFDHPANKRPNYQFGQWDPHLLDNQARYRRFVLVEVTLESLYERTQSPGGLPPGEALYEAAAVLAGTILMASGTSGSGPDAHDSTVTLAKLVPAIAAYRDRFYTRLLEDLAGEHGKRLRAEAQALRQPLGGARQDLNQRLARLRAAQLQHVHLAQLFARMGYPEASRRQAEVVPVASARMLCEISTRITSAHHALARGRPVEASPLAAEIEDLLHRAIECGALVDPWNILGFQGQFSLFPAMENSVRDHRVDVLTALVHQIFGLFARLQSEAAARGLTGLDAELSDRLSKLARWWDRFATLDVAGIAAISGQEASQSAAHVAAALGAWHKGGAASGNLAFWRPHVERFNSPKAYALVIAALLEKEDFVASMALLIQWLGRAEQVPLADGEHSFHELAVRWLGRLCSPAPEAPEAGGERLPLDRWALVKKLFDFMEANAEEYWEAPRFEFAAGNPPRGGELALPSDDDESKGEEHLFSAAYEEMTYRDSTLDGNEADLLEGQGPASDFELDAEAARLRKRLAFLSTLARLWTIAAASAARIASDPAKRDAALVAWFDMAVVNRRGLFNLMKNVHRYRLPEPSGTIDALVEYDRRRHTKESLLAAVIDACVETSDAARLLLAAGESNHGGDDLADWEQQAVEVLRAMACGDVARVRRLFSRLRAALEQESILYVPLERGGAPAPIVGVKTLERLLWELLAGLPKLGMLTEAAQVIAAILAMERHRPSGEMPVTEFHRLFEAGYGAMVESLVRAAAEDSPGETGQHGAGVSDEQLVDGLAALGEPLMKCWLAHGRSLRLSVLEKVAQAEAWEALRSFVERYGHDLFTPRFLNPGNLRGILQQGVDAWFDRLEQDPDAEPAMALLDDLDRAIPRAKAAEMLKLVVEAIEENYAEFKDFATTTTQSDRGELLYVLLDFLRLKADYERFAWNTRPLVVAHEVLVRRGRSGAAELWRRAVAQRTAPIADWHLKRLAELSKQYGVRLPTVADRLGERFVRPLAIDRLRALIQPAIDEARRGEPPTAFALLEQELTEFTDNPSGSGLDVPDWIAALEHEAATAGPRGRRADEQRPDRLPVPLVPLAWDDLQSQVRLLDEHLAGVSS